MNENNLEILSLPLESWQEYKELRLRALQREPQAFGSNYAREVEYPNEKWQQRIQGVIDGQGLMLFARLDGKLVGMIGGYQDDDNKPQKRIQIWGMYVDPEARGRGIAKTLMNNLISKIRERGDILIAKLEVNEDQDPAKKLYENMGFKIVGTKTRALGDGKKHQLLEMELDLI
jgi:ribosomal protein S18 acetylase RimI-like enzyme